MADGDIGRIASGLVEILKKHCKNWANWA
jgi:hypothetical protein